MAEPDTSQAPSPKTILKATGVAFVVGLIVLLAAILPAEFGVDPLGTGELTGVIALSRAENPFEEQLEMHRSDFVEFELGPFQSVEYKYTMDLDAPMVFTWVADGEVYFDMHAEPAGIGAEGAESFEQGNDVSRTGSFHAPFNGIHGWFWENRGLSTVVVRLYASGFFLDSTVFRDGGDYSRVIDPVAE
ncbi:MAG: hypothetical protein OXU66_01565 [Gammaproteobacteria bacterium]|nr:hypothetical protein [Gammaproteobacteria bacterium]